MQGFKEKISTKLPVAGGSAAWGGITGTLSSQTDLQTALDGKVDENTAITGATKTKITYDAKGLVTSGTDATTADIADSTDKRYVTDANLTVIGNTSGTNTGDQTSIVGITGTKAQFDTAVSDGNIMYVGDAPTAHTHSPSDITGTAVVTSDSRLSDARTPTAHTHPQSDITNLTTDLAAKQETLVSGTNIKTVNGSSLLGSGDLAISSSDPTYLQTSFTIVTGSYKSLPDINLLSTNRITIQGTGRLRINN